MFIPLRVIPFLFNLSCVFPSRPLYMRSDQVLRLCGVSGLPAAPVTKLNNVRTVSLKGILAHTHMNNTQ